MTQRIRKPCARKVLLVYYERFSRFRNAGFINIQAEMYEKETCFISGFVSERKRISIFIRAITFFAQRGFGDIRNPPERAFCAEMFKH